MSEPRPPPYRTGALWMVLTLLLMFGTVGAASVVYGASLLLASGPWWEAVPAIAIGGVASGLCFLLLAGILYRVDRIRGSVHRRVELFE